MHNIFPKCNTTNNFISTMPNTEEKQGKCTHTGTTDPDSAGGNNLPTINTPYFGHLDIDNNIRELWLIQRDAIRTSWNKNGQHNHEKTSQRSASSLWIKRRIIAMLLIIGSVTLLFTARKSVVAFLPGMAPVYAAIGYPVNLRGLEFQDIAVEWNKINTTSTLIINGKVINITQMAQTAPKISFSLLDKNRTEVYRWTEEMQKQNLAPNQPVSFSTKLPNPPKAHSIQLRFVNQQKG